MSVSSVESCCMSSVMSFIDIKLAVLYKVCAIWLSHVLIQHCSAIENQK